MQHYDALGRWNTDDLTHVTTTDNERRLFALAEGDLLFNTRNSTELVGKAALWPARRPGHVYNNNLLRLRFRDGIVPAFMRWALMAPPAADALAVAKSATTSVAAIYQRDLMDVMVPVPSPDVQKQVAESLDTALLRTDAAEGEATRALTLLNRLEQTILAKAFRGELVPQDASDEPAAVTLVRNPAPKTARASRRAPSASGSDSFPAHPAQA